MDLNGLIWTKNVRPLDGERWAYESIPTIYPDLNIFALHWRNLDHKDEINASKPQEGELIILRQHGKVTHIVQMLNKKVYVDQKAGNEFNIYRIVKVVWMADNWDIPPDAKEVFGCDINFPPNGKVIQLDHLQEFQKRWNTQEITFEQHVQKVLNIH